MKKFDVGTTLFVVKGGRGWRKIEGYTVKVVDRDEIVEFVKSGGYVEGLGLEGELFVEVSGLIYEDDEGEFTDLPEDYRVVEFDVDTIWGIDGTGELRETGEHKVKKVVVKLDDNFNLESVAEEIQFQLAAELVSATVHYNNDLNEIYVESQSANINALFEEVSSITDGYRNFITVV